MKKLIFVPFMLLFLLLAACSNDTSTNSDNGHDMNNMEESEDKAETTTNETEDVKIINKNEFTITAKEGMLKINENIKMPVWTFNGSVPGSEIRVKEGENVKIHLKNELPEPVTIHWHGVPVPNDMDGIPGVTMNAVQPGETFTYEFKATVPGTYWYHSHQDSVNQVDKGLYGAFIIESKENDDVDRDYTLVLDEWMSNPENSMEMEGMDHSNMDMGGEDKNSTTMSGMDHGSMNNDEEMDHSNDTEGKSDEMQGHDMSMYDIFTINGKSGSSVEPLAVKEGERIRIRLINAGFMSHKIHLHGHDFKVTAIDGQPINDPQSIKDQLISIAPGERYDIEFTANNPGMWFIECHGDMEGTEGMKTLIQYEGVTELTDKANESEELPIFDFTTYGKNEEGPFTLDQDYNLEYTMELDTQMKESQMVYTINNEVSPNTEEIEVKEGDLVKVRFVNKSESDDHPMHLHGHFFQVLSKNGEPLKGSPIMKDTLNIKPGEEYVVAFKADNPGNWMFHCHDLHHASAGMVTKVIYTDYETDFVADPNANNKPE